MPNIMSGRGQLRSLLPPQAEFEVNYEIHFDSKTVRETRGRLPRIERQMITDATITAIDGRLIPEGQYILTDRRPEYHLAKGFNGKRSLR